MPEDTGPELTGRDRLLRAMRTPGSRGQAVAGVLLAVLGFAAVAQVRAQDQDQDRGFVAARQADLIALINTLSLATDRAETDLADLRETRDSLLDDTEATRTALAVARERADTLGILAGSVPAEGPGIRITVEAPEGAVGTDQMLNGIQELRNAGAEAVEINDAVRVIAQTAFSDSPTTGLEVDGEAVSAPYVVEAIGDPHTLATALEIDGGFIDEVEEVGGKVRVEDRDQLEITATRSVADPRFAEPADGD